MDAIAKDLLLAAVRYLLGRIRQVATPEDLAALAGIALPADPAPILARVQAATGHATDAEAAAPADPVAAAKHAWLAAAEIMAAVRQLGADPAATITASIATVKPQALVAALGLPAPTVNVPSTADRIDLVWSRPQVAVAPFRVGVASLGVRISADGVRMTVRAEAATLDLGAGAPGVIALLVGAAGDVTADVELTVDHRGLHSGGSLGPIALPARLQAQVVDLDGLELALEPGGPTGLRLTLRSRLSVDVAGVIRARVDRFGIALAIDPTRILGGHSPFGAPGFVGPEGVALALDAPPVKGAGALIARGHGYGGALELTLGPVKVTAFGLLRSDNGRLSFVAVMSVTFPVPIELGLLFTLNAVGGIVGIGVGLNTDAIRAGLKDGTLDHLMFPSDIVGAAPTILKTLDRVFPPLAGGFVIGPMARLAWGRPVSLVTLDVAVLVAVPDPVILVLGRARVAIPSEQAALIDIRAAVMVQVGRGVILLRAELYSSRVGFMSVYGGIGMLIRFGDDPTIVISAGGFHPAFAHKPAELADLSRIGAEMSPPIGLQFRVRGYVALTTNTVQFGGAIEVGYSVGVAAVRGSLTLDAIIQFDPFGFEVDVSASAHVEAFGISLIGVRLALHLAGPSPWIVQGTGSISLPWPLPDPSISIGPISVGDGPPPDPPPPAVDALEEARRELSDRRAWQRVDRHGQSIPVRLTAAPADPTSLVIEPWGLLRARQRLVPLGMALDRWGAAPVTPVGCRIQVAGAVKVGEVGVDASDATKSPVVESFAIGQFLALTGDEQLAAPEFEDRQGGIALDPAGAETGAADLVPYATSASMTYEDSWRGRPERPPLRPFFFDFSEWAQLVLDAGPAGATRLRTADRYRDEAAERVIVVRASTDARVTDVDTGAVRSDFAPWSDAVRTARAVPGGLASMTGVAR